MNVRKSVNTSILEAGCWYTEHAEFDVCLIRMDQREYTVKQRVDRGRCLVFKWGSPALGAIAAKRVVHSKQWVWVLMFNAQCERTAEPRSDLRTGIFGKRSDVLIAALRVNSAQSERVTNILRSLECKHVGNGWKSESIDIIQILL